MAGMVMVMVVMVLSYGGCSGDCNGVDNGGDDNPGGVWWRRLVLVGWRHVFVPAVTLTAMSLQCVILLLLLLLLPSLPLS